MIKSITLFFIFMVAPLTFLTAQDDCNRGFYVGGFGGINYFTHDGNYPEVQDPGFILGASIGYKTRYNFRFEGEFCCRRNIIDLGDSSFDLKMYHKNVTYMINALYDFNVSKSFMPYAGIGWGYSYKEQYGYSKLFGVGMEFCDHKFNFFQFITGVSIPIFEKTEVGIEGRYLTDFGYRKYYSADLAIRRYF